MPGDALQVGEERVRELDPRVVAEPMPVPLEIDDVWPVECRVGDQPATVPGAIRSRGLPRGLGTQPKTADVTIAERDRLGLDSAEPATDQHGNLVRRLDDCGNSPSGVGNDADT